MLFLLMLSMVSESPRWMLLQGDIEGANAVMRGVAAGNGRQLQGWTGLAEPKKQLEPESVFAGCLMFRMQIMVLAWFANSNMHPISCSCMLPRDSERFA